MMTQVREIAKEIEGVQAQLQDKVAEKDRLFQILDDYQTELSCMDKPDLLRAARVLSTKYTVRTKNYLMIGHLMTVRRRELGYDAVLDAVDALTKRLNALKEA